MTLVVVTGVGTEVGKTHVAASLLRAWGKDGPVIGYKPVESGVSGGLGPDAALLEESSTFHVKRPPYRVTLRAPVSPHLAARMAGRAVDLEAIALEASRLREAAPVVVELPGGLFSPLTDALVNADLVERLRPDRVLLVAPNRLGVLHDVRAVFEAARARGLRLDGVVLSAVLTPDASAPTNAAELILTSGLPLLAVLPRGTIAELAASAPVRALLRLCRLANPETAALE